MNIGAQTTQSVRFRNLFEPDILSNFQFSKVYQQKAHFDPEERLAFAVLTDAVECFQRYNDATSRKARLLFKNAQAWIMSNDVRYPFSFVNTCETLNIAPAYLRVGLIRWLANQQSRHPKRKRIRETLRYQNRVARGQINH